MGRMHVCPAALETFVANAAAIEEINVSASNRSVSWDTAERREIDRAVAEMSAATPFQTPVVRRARQRLVQTLVHEVFHILGETNDTFCASKLRARKDTYCSSTSSQC